MKLKSFQVRKFRNIVDSGEVLVDPKVTCLVGKNEAGKSGMLEALYLLNPAYGETFSVRDQYPRWLATKDRREGELEEHAPISATFALEKTDVAAVSRVLGEGALTGNEATVQKKYGSGGVWTIEWSEAKAVKNLITGFPAPVKKRVDGVQTLKDLIAKLEERAAEEGPTAEELTIAKQAVQTRGLHDTSVWQRIVHILRERVPKFFRFTSYSTLPGRIDFNELKRQEDGKPGQDDLQTARALLRLAGTDLDQLGEDEYEDRKAELEAVSIDLTNQVFEYWKQNPHLKVTIDVDKVTEVQGNNRTAVARFLDIRLQDSRTGYSNNFKQRSSGFQWLFSFLAAFSAFEDEETPIILLDEPALTLHGKAQADFLRFINERLAPAAPVLYTTHSPFMIEPDRLERVRIVEDHGPPKGATASSEVLGADADSLFPLQAALGYDIAQNLFVGPHNLLVEGTSDYIYLTVMSRLCQQSGRTGLDERWRVLPAGGATNIPTFVSLIGPHLDVTVLADSDTKGMQRVTNMVERNLLAEHRLIMASTATAGEQADIEDLFSEGDYLALFNKTYGANLKVKDLPEGSRIVKRIEAHQKTTFVHGEVAETLLRHHHEIKFSETTLDRFALLIETVNRTISSWPRKERTPTRCARNAGPGSAWSCPLVRFRRFERVRRIREPLRLFQSGDGPGALRFPVVAGFLKYAVPGFRHDAVGPVWCCPEFYSRAMLWPRSPAKTPVPLGLESGSDSDRLKFSLLAGHAVNHTRCRGAIRAAPGFCVTHRIGAASRDRRTTQHPPLTASPARS